LTYRQLLSTNPDFRRLWIGQVISEIGDWLNNIAVLALTIELAGAGHEGQAVAFYAIARHLPLFLFGPLAGVVADRVDRRRVMIVADIARALLALGFLLANMTGRLSMIYIAGASLFAVSSFFNSAKRASIPNVVSHTAALLSANSISASTTAATIAIGSALGGLFSTFIGRNAVFVLNAITFLISAEMIRRVRLVRRTQSEKESAGRVPSVLNELVDAESTVAKPRLHSAFWKDFREGLRYVRERSVLRVIFVVGAGWGLGNGVARALYSIFGAQLGIAAAGAVVERPTDFGISVLFIAMGIGGIMGAPIARRFNSAKSESLGSRMGRSMIFDGCGLTLFSLMPTLWTAAAVLVARELNFAIWWTAQQTIIMIGTEDAFRGRTFASYETVTTLMMVGSMLAAGAAADRFGIRPVAATGGAVIILSGVLWFVLRRSQSPNSRSDTGDSHAPIYS
jgi:MFS family permease